MSILADIYNGKYQPQAKPTPLPQELRAADIAFWEKVREALGIDCIDEYLYRHSEQEALSDIDHFREGFRLGVLLMLEVLQA